MSIETRDVGTILLSTVDTTSSPKASPSLDAEKEAIGGGENGLHVVCCTVQVFRIPWVGTSLSTVLLLLQRVMPAPLCFTVDIAKTPKATAIIDIGSHSTGERKNGVARCAVSVRSVWNRFQLVLHHLHT